VIGTIALVVGVGVVSRFAQMKLSVTRTSVVVVNYTSRHEFALDSVRVVDERETPTWLSDMGGKRNRTSRTMYLMDDSGQRVHVALAPMYGTRMDTIAEDLYRAIDRMRTDD
jgi:hypothetical protein